MNKSRFFSFDQRFTSFSSLSLRILHIGLPVILLYLISLLFSMLSSAYLGSSALSYIYSTSLEHIIMALTINVVGAIVADLAERHK